MPDKPVEVEKVGIEHIPLEERHGSAGRVFTLWFGANLTVADYVIGVISVQVFGLTVWQALPILLVGNLLAGLVLGLSASMGPKLGYPQMMSSRSSFGRQGNYLFGGLNWISTIGWFTVNTILGVEALQAVYPQLNFYAGAAALVAIQIVVAVYGHDFIQLFERVMSIVLGVLFLIVFLLAVRYNTGQLAFLQPVSGGPLALGTVAIALATSFSYLMSWSPYASDYTRYLSPTTSGRRVAVYAFLGGALASFAIEMVGAYVGSLTPGLATFQALNFIAEGFGSVAILAIVLGVFSANALNLYTNALSALVLDVRTKRWVTVLAGGLVGFALAAVGQENFVLNFENFLLVLDYWIMPWLGIVLVDYFVLRRTTPEGIANPRSWDPRALGIYAVAVLVSVPFMVPALNLGFPFGALASVFGGADFSYFVSFFVAIALAWTLRMGAGRGTNPAS